MKKHNEHKEHKEHKSKNRDQEDLAPKPQDIVRVLDRIKKTLPESDLEEVAKIREEIALRMERLNEEIAKQKMLNKQKAMLESEIQHLKESATTGLTAYEELVVRQSKGDKEEIARAKLEVAKKRETLTKKIEILEKELVASKIPQADTLKPYEMTQALDSVTDHSYQELLEKVGTLKTGDSIEQVTDLTKAVDSITVTTAMKHKIDSRKKFLDKTEQDLQVVTKLPNTPGDEDNMSGFIANIKTLQDSFLPNREINDKRIDLLENAAKLLLQLRGYLKSYHDPIKYPISKSGLTGTDGGLLSFLQGPNLNSLYQLLTKGAKLTEEFKLLYDFIVPDQNVEKNLMLTLEKHKDFLSREKQFNQRKFFKTKDFYDLGFVRGEDGSVVKQDVTLKLKSQTLKSQTLHSGGDLLSSKALKIQEEYHEELSKIITSSFYDNVLINGKPILIRNNSQYGTGKTSMNIIMEYLDETELPLNFSKHVEYLINSSLGRAKYYTEQLKYTETAIHSLKKIQGDFISSKKHDASLFFTIKDALPVFENSHTIISIIKEYLTIENDDVAKKAIGFGPDESGYYFQSNRSEQLLDSLLKAGAAIKFCHYLRNYGKVDELQKFLLNLNSINIKSASSNSFPKILDGQLKSILFIDQLIKLVTKVEEFFHFSNIRKLQSDKDLLTGMIGDVENYLVKAVAPSIKLLVKDLISKENSLLDHFNHLIDHSTKSASKNIKASDLQDVLIRLADNKPTASKEIFNRKALDKLLIVADYEDRAALVAKMRKGGSIEPELIKESVSALLYNLISSGHADAEMVEQFLTAKPVINFQKNGDSYLHLIARQLTMVGRELQFNYKDAYGIPRIQKYVIDAPKQQKLFEMAMYLIEQGANINLPDKDGSGFLTSLFGKLPEEQSRFLYLILFKNEKILEKLSLQDTDLYGRSVAHLFLKDTFDFFYNSTNKVVAKKLFADIIRKIVKEEHHEDILRLKDKEGNTPLHYLASSITEEFWDLRDSSSGIRVEFRAGFSKFKLDLLNIKNIHGESPLHIAFTKASDPCAFYDFMLYRICSPMHWHENSELDLHAKNVKGVSVLDMLIETDSQRLASTINAYLSNIIFKLGIDKDTGIRDAGKLFVFNEEGGLISTNVGLLDEYLPSELYRVNEIIKTIFLSYLYQAPAEPSCTSSSSSCSSTSSSSSGMSWSSMSATFSSVVSHVTLKEDGVVEVVSMGSGDEGLEWHSSL